MAAAGAGTGPSRRYVNDTRVLAPTWVGGTGTARVIAFMPPRGHAPDVVRIVEGVSPVVPMRTALRLRSHYGRVVP